MERPKSFDFCFSVIISEKEWTLGSACNHLRELPDISWFPMIVRLKSFGDS